MLRDFCWKSARLLQKTLMTGLNQTSGLSNLLPAFYLGFFTFQFFVNREEVFDFAEDMPGKIAVVLDSLMSGAPCRHGEDLLIFYFLIQHIEQTHWPGLHNTARKSRVRRQHQDVQRVAVFTQRARDKSVLARVMHGGIKRSIQPENVERLVVLVFVGLPLRDLDYCSNCLRSVLADWQY